MFNKWLLQAREPTYTSTETWSLSSNQPVPDFYHRSEDWSTGSAWEAGTGGWVNSSFTVYIMGADSMVKSLSKNVILPCSEYMFSFYNNKHQLYIYTKFFSYKICFLFAKKMCANKSIIRHTSKSTLQNHYLEMVFYF